MPCSKFQYRCRIISPLQLEGGGLWLPHPKPISEGIKTLPALKCEQWINYALQLLGRKGRLPISAVPSDITEFSALPSRCRDFSQAEQVEPSKVLTWPVGDGNILSCSNSRLGVRTIEPPRCNSFTQIIIEQLLCREQYQALDMEQTSRQTCSLLSWGVWSKSGLSKLFLQRV